MESEKKQINTIHERDIENLLIQLGIKEQFLNNELNCKFCKDTVNMENIYSFLPESGTVNIICDKPKCITDLMLYIDNKKRNKIVE